MDRARGFHPWRKRLAIVVIPGILGALAPVPPALAASCAADEQIFVRSTASRTSMKGTTNQILLRDRPLETSCTTSNSCTADIVMTLSTAHVDRDFTQNSPSGDWVEIGWVEHWSIAGSQHTWSVFTEKGRNFSKLDCFEQPAPNLNPGTYDLWRASGAVGANGTTDWTMRVDFLIGQGFVTVKTYNTSWGSTGSVALGESERRGDGSGMADTQVGLQYKNTSGTWVNWPGVDCVQDIGPIWEWNRLSNNSYEVIQNGSIC